MLTIGLGPAFACGGGGIVSGQGPTPFDLDYMTTSATMAVTTAQRDGLVKFPHVDTSMITDMGTAFLDCHNLESIPLLDTSKVSNMTQMFDNCYKLSVIPCLNTSKVLSMRYFARGCQSLKEMPLLDVSNVTNAMSMFDGCSSLEFVPDLDFRRTTSFNYMFRNCAKLKTVNFTCETNATSMSYMYKGCHELGTVNIDINKVKGTEEAFAECYNLRNCMLGNLKATVSLKDSPLLSKESVLYIFESAQTVTESPAITLHADVFAQLTEDEIAIATEKGFSVVSA